MTQHVIGTVSHEATMTWDIEADHFDGPAFEINSLMVMKQCCGFSFLFFFFHAVASTQEWKHIVA